MRSSLTMVKSARLYVLRARSTELNRFQVADVFPDLRAKSTSSSDGFRGRDPWCLSLSVSVELIGPQAGGLDPS